MYPTLKFDFFTDKTDGFVTESPIHALIVLASTPIDKTGDGLIYLVLCLCKALIDITSLPLLSSEFWRGFVWKRKRKSQNIHDPRTIGGFFMENIYGKT